MEKYSTRKIKNTVSKLLAEGTKTANVCDVYLSMVMANDNTYVKKVNWSSPPIHDIMNHLLFLPTFNSTNVKLHSVQGKYNSLPLYSLKIEISPTCTFTVKKSHEFTIIEVNTEGSTYLSGLDAEGVANWIARQKSLYESYMAQWEMVLKQETKKSKLNSMAAQYIRGLFSDAMKDLPDIQYEVIEQRRRIRFKVMLPNCKLGVYIDCWWGSYREKLPEQIESLQLLIDVHRRIIIKEFFITK